VRHALLGFLQLVAVVLVGVLTYGLTFLLAENGPWPYRAAAGLTASAAIYLGAIRARPRPWLAESEVAALPPDKGRPRTPAGS
jgi:hypothetical protein